MAAAFIRQFSSSYAEALKQDTEERSVRKAEGFSCMDIKSPVRLECLLFPSSIPCFDDNQYFLIQLLPSSSGLAAVKQWL